MSRSGPLTTLIISGSHHYYYLFINKDLITYSVHYTLSLIIFLINVSLFVLFITLSLSLSDLRLKVSWASYFVSESEWGLKPHLQFCAMIQIFKFALKKKFVQWDPFQFCLSFYVREELLQICTWRAFTNHHLELINSLFFFPLIISCV